MAQIPLQLSLNEVFNLNNFLFAQAEIERAITSFCKFDEINFLYLWGGKATGKTHLLLAVVNEFQQASKRALFLPLVELAEQASPEVLESVENLDVLCIDDLDAIAGKAEWEEALFHCFNRLQHTGCKLVISSTHNPSMIAIKLADLRSRLATGLIYQLEILNDDEKHQMLMLQAQARGLKLSEEVAHYLLRHHSRDNNELISLLKQLDSASMVEQRRLTIPFVRQILANG